MTITEFLNARLDEDEAVARAADVKQGDPSWQRHGPVALSDPRAFRIRSERDSRPIALVQDVSGDDGDADRETAILDGEAAAEHIARHDPARVLAEVEAKRRIMEHHRPNREGDLCDICTETGPDAQGWPCLTVRLLALPYAGHPRYREEWRP